MEFMRFLPRLGAAAARRWPALPGPAVPPLPSAGASRCSFIKQMLEGLGRFLLPPLYQGHRKKVTTNFNKNKIKMIKPFISFRDYLFAAGWSKQS